MLYSNPFVCHKHLRMRSISNRCRLGIAACTHGQGPSSPPASVQVKAESGNSNIQLRQMQTQLNIPEAIFLKWGGCRYHHLRRQHSSRRHARRLNLTRGSRPEPTESDKAHNTRAHTHTKCTPIQEVIEPLLSFRAEIEPS